MITESEFVAFLIGVVAACATILTACFGGPVRNLLRDMRNDWNEYWSRTERPDSPGVQTMPDIGSDQLPPDKNELFYPISRYNPKPPDATKPPPPDAPPRRQPEQSTVFSCPHCGEPSAHPVGPNGQDVYLDIHGGATWFCSECGGSVIFETYTVDEWKRNGQIIAEYFAKQRKERS